MSNNTNWFMSQNTSQGGGNNTSSVKITFRNKSVLGKSWTAEFQVMARLDNTSQVPINNMQTISLSGIALSSDSTNFMEFDNNDLAVRNFIVRPISIKFAGSTNTYPIKVTPSYYVGSSKINLDTVNFTYNVTLMNVPVEGPVNSKYELEISI